MDIEKLKESIKQYKSQLELVNETLAACTDDGEKQSLYTLQDDLNKLLELTVESLQTIEEKAAKNDNKRDTNTEIDDEYALFQAEMAKSGAYHEDKETKGESSKNQNSEQRSESEDSDIEDELATLLGMKCAVHHTHKWGGQPTLHNAMVSAVIPRENKDKFKDLQVRVLFTHPTHSEMLPCPFYLEGECRFDDEKCRYSHGTIVSLCNLKEAIEPDFESVKVGSRLLVKLKPPDSEDITLKRKSTEKYYLWHRSVVRNIDMSRKTCIVKLEHGVSSGEKRKSSSDEITVEFENTFPLNNESVSDTDSDDSLSDTEYPEMKTAKPTPEGDNQALIIEKSLQNSGPALGEWERHTRGIGSKLMLAMGYVAGAGLGAAGEGRVLPVAPRLVPRGRGLDHCSPLQDLKIEQKLKRMQKKQEQRQERAYQNEIERENRNVFNFLNKTIGGDKQKDTDAACSTSSDIKQSTNQDLNIQHFKVNEDTKRLEREVLKLQSSLGRHSEGSSGHRNVRIQIQEKTKELDSLRIKEQQIAKEQTQRKNKQKMTIF